MMMMVCVLAYFERDVSMKKAEVQAEIEAKAAIERVKLEEHEATLRTKERMQLIPWYNATPEPAGK
jgi:hypothetical protein